MRNSTRQQNQGIIGQQIPDDITELQADIDFNQSWRFKPSEEDHYREAKQIRAKKQALLLAAKVDRTAINEMLLEKTDRFRSTPKYAAVTQRLYQPYREFSSGIGGGASTMAESERAGTIDGDDLARGHGS